MILIQPIFAVLYRNDWLRYVTTVVMILLVGVYLKKNRYFYDLFKNTKEIV